MTIDRTWEQFKPTPDLSIEVIFTSVGPSKLARYQALGVPEVWFWEDGLFSLCNLRGNAYERITKSEVPGLEDLDFESLTRYVLIAQTSRLTAAKEFRQAVQSMTRKVT